MDYIIEEELWRSIPVYFYSFLIIGILNMVIGTFNIKGSTIFILAFLLTVVHFRIMIWYRKKEHIVDPSIQTILKHAFRSDE